MAEVCGHYDKGEADPTYDAAEYAPFIKMMKATGVAYAYLNALAVTATGGGLAVYIDTGGAFLEGYYYINTAQLEKSVDPEGAGTNRIDRVIVRNTVATKTAEVVILKGTGAVTPVAPALTQTGAVYEISLAQVYVAGEAVNLLAGDITDERTYTTTAANIHVLDAGGHYTGTDLETVLAEIYTADALKLPLTAGSSFPLTGDLIISRGANNGWVKLTGNSGKSKGVLLQTGGFGRWGIYSNDAAEAGANSGSDLVIRRYSDAEADLGIAFGVDRATGAMDINGAVTVTNLLSGSVPMIIKGAAGQSVPFLQTRNSADTVLASIDQTGKMFSGALTASTAVYADANKGLTSSDTTATELGRVHGITDSIMTLLGGKSDTGHTHSYLPLSGGTLAGNLVFGGAWNGAHLVVGNLHIWQYNSGPAVSSLMGKAAVPTGESDGTEIAAFGIPA